MSVRVLTLFGEEVIPEQMNAVGRPAKAKKAKPAPEGLTGGPAPTEEAPENLPATGEPGNPIAQQEGHTPLTAAENPSVISAGTAARKAKMVIKRRPATTAPEKEVAGPEAGSDFLDGWEGEKQYYTIGEVAKLFKVNTSHIRFWTNEFELKVRTTRKGDRLYTPEQVREIRGIYHLVKEKRYTISGAKAKLKDKTVSVDAIDLKKSLLHLRNKLLTIRNQLS